MMESHRQKKKMYEIFSVFEIQLIENFVKIASTLLNQR
jgi:hypothetical protein